MKWWDRMPWSLFSECWAFKPTLSLSTFTFINRLFSSSSLSAIRVASSAYLRSLIFSRQSWFQLVFLPVQHFSCRYQEMKCQILSYFAYWIAMKGYHLQSLWTSKEIYIGSQATDSNPSLGQGHEHISVGPLLWTRRLEKIILMVSASFDDFVLLWF